MKICIVFSQCMFTPPGNRHLSIHIRSPRGALFISSRIYIQEKLTLSFSWNLVLECIFLQKILNVYFYKQCWMYIWMFKSEITNKRPMRTILRKCWMYIVQHRNFLECIFEKFLECIFEILLNVYNFWLFLECIFDLK